ncbi:hypothetical protein Taro_010330 [Colocasia esculenta]|uniref:Uncharacterized protein n=1 Tax=Colocasia esculenta TaxID=4460 RepID=A0A843UCQ8_COLES|nr:hypothetical protein [Colocasia esculenta]
MGIIGPVDLRANYGNYFPGIFSGKRVRLLKRHYTKGWAIIKVLLEELLELLLGAVVVAPAATSISAHVAIVTATLEIPTEPANLSSVCCHLLTTSSWLSTAPVIQMGVKLKGIMDMNAQDRMVAALEMLRQDIELYAQAQQEAHMQIKEEVLNLTAGAFFAGNPGASLDVMTQVMCRLDNLRLGQDMLLHQFEGYWEALTDAARELYHGAGKAQQPPPTESIIDLT